MKNVIFTMVIVLASLLGFSQVTPTQVYRIADATTPFGVSISVGKQVYNIATHDLWIATAAVQSTATLTTAMSSFNIVNGAGTTNLNEANVTATTVDVTSSTGDAATLQSATSERAGLMSQEKFNQVELNNLKETNVSTALTLGTIGANTLGITSDGSADDVTLPAANITQAGLMTADNVIKLAAIEPGSQVNYTLFTEKFEETSSTATVHPLSHTAQTSGCHVSLNGNILNPVNYAFTDSSIKVNLPVNQYDEVVITYNY